ncbi:MAG: hypothetical protein ACRCU2_12580 [Planktothrix sp.]
MNHQKVLFNTLSLGVLSLSLLGGCTSPPEQPLRTGDGTPPVTSSAPTAQPTPSVTLESLKAQVQELNRAMTPMEGNQPLPEEFTTQWQEFVNQFGQYENELEPNQRASVQPRLLTIQEQIRTLNSIFISDAQENPILSPGALEQVRASLPQLETELGAIDQQLTVAQTVTQPVSPSAANSSEQSTPPEPRQNSGSNQLGLGIFLGLVFGIVGTFGFFMMLKADKDSRRRQPGNIPGPPGPSVKPFPSNNEISREYFEDWMRRLKTEIANNSGSSSQGISPINSSSTAELSRIDSRLGSLTNSVNDFNRLLRDVGQQSSGLEQIVRMIQRLEGSLNSLSSVNQNRLSDSHQSINSQQLNELQYQIETLTKEKQNWQYQFQQLEQEKINREGHIETLNQELKNYRLNQFAADDLQKQVSWLKQQIREKEQEINAIQTRYQQQSGELNSQAQSYRIELQEKQNQIDNLEAELERLKVEINELRNPPQSYQAVYSQPSHVSTQALPSYIQDVVEEYNHSDLWYKSVQKEAEVCEPDELYNKRRGDSRNSVILTDAGNRGEYTVISVNMGASSEFWLFPKFKKMSDALYSSTGKVLFNFHNYQSGTFDFVLIKPAKVISQGADWKLQEKGEIQVVN